MYTIPRNSEDPMNRLTLCMWPEAGKRIQRIFTTNWEPTFRILDPCALRLSQSEQMNWLNVYSWTSLNTNFCFSVCHVNLSEMENWIVISKVQMESLVYSIILYTKWNCRRFKIYKGLPKIQTHYSFQQIWQFLNYIIFWTIFFSPFVLTEVNLKILLLSKKK